MSCDLAGQCEVTMEPALCALSFIGKVLADDGLTAIAPVPDAFAFLSVTVIAGAFEDLAGYRRLVG